MNTRRLRSRQTRSPRGRPSSFITIDPGGTIRFIYSDGLAPLLEEGEAVTTRASHVEPAPGGGWIADMSPVGGGTLGPFGLRQQALDAEVAWLNENFL